MSNVRTMPQANPSHERMSKLAERFPSLRGAMGVRPWRAAHLALWATSGRSHGEAVAARFVLHVWNGDTEWPWGNTGGLRPFDLFEARNVWDADHERAFRDWVAEDWRFFP